MREHRELQTLIDQLNVHTREQDEAIKALQKTNEYLVTQLKKAMLAEREACAVLVEADGRVHPKAPDFVWRQTVAKLIRARGEPSPAFKNYMGDNWAGIV